MPLSRARISAMTSEERRALVVMLRDAESMGALPTITAKRRRIRLSAMGLATLAMIPWTIYLALSLPAHYTARNWALTWAGFDVALVASMGATAFFAWKRRQVVLLTSFSTSILLMCDAWFDLSTAAGGDRVEAVVSALCLELPLAALLMSGALRILRITAQYQGSLPEGARLWDLPLFGVRR